jgi:hypothetical protein
MHEIVYVNFFVPMSRMLILSELFNDAVNC